MIPQSTQRPFDLSAQNIQCPLYVIGGAGLLGRYPAHGFMDLMQQVCDMRKIKIGSSGPDRLEGGTDSALIRDQQVAQTGNRRHVGLPFSHVEPERRSQPCMPDIGGQTL